MKTVLIISFSDLSTDPRVNRQIRMLKDHYRVVAAGFSDPAIPGVRFIPILKAGRSRLGQAWSAILLLSGRFETYYWRTGPVRSLLEQARGVEADVVLANDIESLPAALALGPRVVFDAHEYAPLQFEDQWRFNLFWRRYKKHLCDTYMPRTEATMTVSEGIAERFEQDTGQRPSVVTNAPDYEDIRPAPRRSDDTIRLIHHGGLSASRRLGEMIRVMDFLDDRFELNLMLVQNDRDALERLKSSAKGNPRVRLLAPVPMRDIPKALNAFDVGLVLFPPVTFNLRHALPNKFFEFVQARLAIATGPSEEMAAIIHRYGLGIVSDDFTPESMAAALTALNRDTIEAFKQHAHEAAYELSAAGNRERLVQLVGECTG